MIKVDALIPYFKELVSVDSSSSIKEVCSIMISEGVSYLPVIDRGVKNIGVYQRKQLFKWMFSNPGKDIDQESVKSFQSNPLQVVNYETSLKEVLSVLDNLSTSAVLVKHEGKFKNLITPRVIANFLDDYSKRFMLFEELEHIIRQKIRDKNVDLSKIHSETINGSIPSSPELLNFSHYKTVLSIKWDEFGYPHPKKYIMELLSSASEYRNALMHFRIDNSVSSKKLKDAKKLINLLK